MRFQCEFDAGTSLRRSTERSTPARRTGQAGGVNEMGVYPGVGVSATETVFFRDFLESSQESGENPALWVGLVWSEFADFSQFAFFACFLRRGRRVHRADSADGEP